MPVQVDAQGGGRRPGPPMVMSQRLGEELHGADDRKDQAEEEHRPDQGKVTCPNFCSPVAPSMLAASYELFRNGLQAGEEVIALYPVQRQVRATMITTMAGPARKSQINGAPSPEGREA